MAKKTTVISLGGSLIVPKKGIDVDFLKGFRKLIVQRIQFNERFLIICGGGTLARDYQNAVKGLMRPTQEELDWVGIHATRLNAHLVRTMFGIYAHAKVFTDPRERVRWKQPVVIGAGWRPGHSTDFDAVMMARQAGAMRVINLSNITHVYDKDPKRHRNAKPLAQISWKDYRAMVGDGWVPGLNSPFDPVASKAAHKVGMEVVIAEGRDLKNLGAILAGQPFDGTVIG